jgi:2-oxoglutarate ferredoxin oxidoreductase subunit alpha
MSPISNILHVLAANQENYGFIYKQPEDEISALNMTIGASFAGARSLTATSGGGFCLMTEAYGLAGMTETPVVIINGMRGAPATGLPTWSEQGDLQFVLHAHQGEFPRLVLAAGDAKEAFDLTMKAFNLADKYQTPVVILLDKNICENDQSYELFDTSGYKLDRGKLSDKYSENYMRYKFESDGISPRTIPGSGNFFLANSDEHDQYGYSTEEIDVRTQMMNKRMQKLTTCEKEDMAVPEIYGAERADITLVSWGSNKGSILQAIKNFKNVNYVHITWMNPFPTQAVKKILSESKYLIDVECNYSGQLANLIREKTGIEILDKLLKYDGRQIFPEEIVDKINSVVKKEGYL